MSIMSKTAGFMGLRALRDLVSDSIAIDMGSAFTMIWVRGRGVVVDEPSIVAVNAITGKIVAFGEEAKQKYGRETRDVIVISPLVEGVVGDFERSKQMLSYFVRKARSDFSHFSRRAAMSVLSGITQVEQRALLNVAEYARIGRVWMIEEGLAAALGAGVKIDDPHASALVDIGAAATNVAIISSGSIIHSRAERRGSSAINAAIINHIRRHRGLTIGALTAERLKLGLASATIPSDLAKTMTVGGREVQAGGPGAIEITAGEIYPVVQYVVGKMLAVVSETLTELSPEVAADIYERGIILTGGGAQLSGLENYLRDCTNLPVKTSDEPKYAALRGLAQIIEEPLTLRRLRRTDSQVLVGTETRAFVAGT
jgi:rod shape-determining protein MreB and related proteins